ncbi:MAG: branched-chain amino acid ABC transporter permease [Candidatus Xiphinematobacter sp.]|nr:MAG: branched-chain amino acid ABC transporter permease [Candidatus Xiphinematobacter sp.]QQY08574.1 MAG: branched-chain amino acid ABC transporter permease [Candidatus Xiphinematobacter sp.]QQY10063.1 MAG: branched-chain amino acid ABC transporter permease [Candidatus Xiphinematobacter sp.]QQY10797.1 MAG: branched-chain amino acid ABC transporter permease [Candidatus Xiphinematobacter sp.]
MEFSQQLINGLSLGSIYALIALGYSMVYGVLRFINFAHGDILMVGAFVGYYLAPGVHAFLGGCGLIPVGIAVLMLTMVVCALLGISIEFFAYRPLRSHPRLTVLITSIGVSLLLEYGGQILFGVSVKPFPSLLPSFRIPLGFGLSVASNHLVALGVSGILLLVLRLLVLRTKLGLAMRALAHNQEAAALMGINTNIIISLTFAAGSALAGAGGILYALNIHSIDPLMGILPGMKAFVAAVLGGIGSLPGAALGGILLGVVESLIGGSPISSYRDAVAFSILILILLLRPTGILGKRVQEKV